ncbi:MAG: SDR family NAD(P)-dependent oxidoreductase [bacterium]|nr:SDR family NAD(P)-dependent oxidoreductase [bacterium]
MSDCLRGKVAIVTGSGGGIGRGIAMAMAHEGAQVLVNDLGCNPMGEGENAHPADAVVAEIQATGGEATANYESIAHVAGAQRLVEQAIDRYGRIDILVNNAGITRVNMLWDMSEEEWDTVIATNLKGTWACIKAAAPHMIEQGSGRIINFSSDMALRGGTGVAPYSASKAGVLGLTITAGLELGVYGITVNAIWPGATSRFREAGAAWRGKYKLGMPASDKTRGEKRPPRTAMDPDDVAPIVVYLARDEARDINAQVFRASMGKLSRVAPIGAEQAVSKQGRWTQSELSQTVPQDLTSGLENPAPKSDDPVWRWMV